MAVLADGIPREARVRAVRAHARPALVLVLALLAASTLTWVALDRRSVTRDLELRQAAHDEVIEIASAKVVQLTTFRPDSAEKDVGRLLAGVTERFRGDFDQQVRAFQEAVVKQKISSTGKVDSAAVTSLRDGAATVLVAASARTRSREAARPETRFYRLRVTLRRTSGSWQLDGMEFV